MRNRLHCFKPIIERCYEKFLLENHDEEEREYPDTADQIREVLIHGNYLSQKDIEICLRFDITSLSAQTHHGAILELHNALISEYGTDEEQGTV